MKYTVCVSLDESLQEGLVKGLGDFRFLKGDSVDFVHIFKEEHYHHMLTPLIYPLPEQRESVSESVLEIMRGIGKKTPSLANAEIDPEYHCLFHESPKVAIVDYLKKSSTDLAFVVTRGKHGIEGLFSSSFAEYLLKFSPCNIFVMR